MYTETKGVKRGNGEDEDGEDDDLSDEKKQKEEGKAK